MMMIKAFLAIFINILPETHIRSKICSIIISILKKNLP